MPLPSARRLPFVATLLLAAIACRPTEPSASAAAVSEREAPQRRPVARSLADTLVFGAIDAAGLWALDTSTVSFRFRQNEYGIDRRGGRFVYTRRYRDSTGARIEDVLTNDVFSHKVNGGAVGLSPKRDSAAREALNSVVYFALLPRPLADAAVRRTYEGVDTLRRRPYHRLRIGFTPEGGGVDHEDEFLYWFDVDDLSLDFLAYRYASGEGGVRFREAFNARRIGGIVVQDYRNYSAVPEGSVPLEAMAPAWQRGDLDLLSTILLEDVRVSTLRGG